MTDEFPADVIAAAKKCAQMVCRNLDYDDVSAEFSEIATTIMAERERSARAAEQRGKELGEPAIGSDIANTIREPGA